MVGWLWLGIAGAGVVSSENTLRYTQKYRVQVLKRVAAEGLTGVLIPPNPPLNRLQVLANPLGFLELVEPAARAELSRFARSCSALSLPSLPLCSTSEASGWRGEPPPIDSEGAEGAEGGSPALSALRNEKPTRCGWVWFSLRAGRQVIDD